MSKKEIINKCFKNRQKYLTQFMIKKAKIFKGIKNLVESKEKNYAGKEEIRVRLPILKKIIRLIASLLIKILRFIKKVLKNKEYFYIRIIILIGIIIGTYDIIYIKRYIISTLILI